MSDDVLISPSDIEQIKSDVSGIKNELREIRQLMIQYLSASKNGEELPTVVTTPTISPSMISSSIPQPSQDNVKSVSKSMMYCSSCSSPIRVDQKFCTSCGSTQHLNVNEESTKNTPQEEDLSYLKDAKVTKQDITDGLKFNYRSIIKISQSTSFTLLGLQLFVIAGILNAGSTAINLLLFGELTDYTEVVQLFAVLFYSYIFIILALSFFIEFSLKNMKLQGVSFTGSMRVTGFLSIVLIARGLLSVIYNLYIYLLNSGELGLSYFALFEAISWFITIILLTIYLVIYLSNRAELSTGFAFLILAVMTGFTVSIYYLYFLNLFYMLSTYNIVAMGSSILGIAASVFLQVRKR